MIRIEQRDLSEHRTVGYGLWFVRFAVICSELASQRIALMTFYAVIHLLSALSPGHPVFNGSTNPVVLSSRTVILCGFCWPLSLYLEGRDFSSLPLVAAGFGLNVDVKRL